MNNTPLILHIEDDDIDAFIVNTMLLKFCGHCDIVRLKNGAEATEYFKNSENKLPSVIILDLIMPLMDGKEFLEEMERIGKLHNLPVVVLSSSNSFCDMQECEGKGVMKYFIKPLTPDISKEILSFTAVS